MHETAENQSVHGLWFSLGKPRGERLWFSAGAPFPTEKRATAENQSETQNAKFSLTMVDAEREIG